MFPAKAQSKTIEKTLRLCALAGEICVLKYDGFVKSLKNFRCVIREIVFCLP
jgi:hypothetical protein